MFLNFFFLIFLGYSIFHYYRHSIKLSRNKVDSKVIKLLQCSLERSHAASLELDSEFSLSLFFSKNQFLGLIHTKICKNRTMNIS